MYIAYMYFADTGSTSHSISTARIQIRYQVAWRLIWIMAVGLALYTLVQRSTQPFKLKYFYKILFNMLTAYMHCWNILIKLHAISTARIQISYPVVWCPDMDNDSRIGTH